MLTALLLLTMFPAFALINAASAAAQADDPAVEIVALEKAMLDRWGTGDTLAFVENAARDITYFDPSLEKRLDGREAFEKMFVPIKGTFRVPKYEMVDPKVQSYGDIAVLSYNMVDYNERGIAAYRMNVTEVFNRQGGRWMLVHSHFSITKPALPMTSGEK